MAKYTCKFCGHRWETLNNAIPHHGYVDRCDLCSSTKWEYSKENNRIYSLNDEFEQVAEICRITDNNKCYARLIAAAPEMYHALELALDALCVEYENGVGILGRVDAKKALHAFGNIKAVLTKIEEV